MEKLKTKKKIDLFINNLVYNSLRTVNIKE